MKKIFLLNVPILKVLKQVFFDKVTNIKGFDTLNLESTVFTSEVVEWELEVRCFILDNEIKTHSSY